MLVINERALRLRDQKALVQFHIPQHKAQRTPITVGYPRPNLLLTKQPNLLKNSSKKISAFKNGRTRTSTD